MRACCLRYVMLLSSCSVEPADYPLAQGAYRQGNWKYTFNEWCTGYYTFDTTIQEQVGYTIVSES